MHVVSAVIGGISNIQTPRDFLLTVIFSSVITLPTLNIFGTFKSYLVTHLIDKTEVIKLSKLKSISKKMMLLAKASNQVSWCASYVSIILLDIDFITSDLHANIFGI